MRDVSGRIRTMEPPVFLITHGSHSAMYEYSGSVILRKPLGSVTE